METPQTSLIGVPPALYLIECPFFWLFFIPTSGRLHSLSHRRASSTHICVYQNQCSGSPSVNDSGGLEPRRMCETTVVELLRAEIRWRSSQLPKWKDAFVYIHNTSRNCAMYFLRKWMGGNSGRFWGLQEIFRGYFLRFRRSLGRLPECEIVGVWC